MEPEWSATQYSVMTCLALTLVPRFSSTTNWTVAFFVPWRRLATGVALMAPAAPPRALACSGAWWASLLKVASWDPSCKGASGSKALPGG